MIELEVGAHYEPWAGKDHDRFMLLESMGRFAVFDGATSTQHHGSDGAARVFRDRHQNLEPGASLPLLSDVFTDDIHDYLQQFESYGRLTNRGGAVTTGTAVGLRPLASGSGRPKPMVEFAHAGDSSLDCLDHDSNRLVRLTRNEDRSNFLGVPGFKLRQWGGFHFSSPHLTLVLLTDGVGTHPAKTGVTREVLHEVLCEDMSAQEKAEELVRTSSIGDDATAVVIEARLGRK